jgi:UDP-N-acetylmuramoyl-tripeptide--D-alanyl-D-alanine ligase
LSYLVAIAFLWFAYRRLLTYLHIYQQEEYDSRRFIRWLFTSYSFDMKVSFLIFVMGTLELAIVLADWITDVLIIAAFLIFWWVERSRRVRSKKPLVMTGRAKRIFWAAFAVLALLSLVIAGWFKHPIFWLIAVQAIPFALTVGNVIVNPYEKKLQKRFWNEAHSKLLSLKPTVIGITGSFGKTSTKHLLGHILELQAPTLITPGSVNTPMGIARVVREQLAPHHRFFICEMGAYGPGSIARLCRLAPPDFAVITAIGMAHYERFKTLDTVAKTKFELAEATAKKNGPVILAEQVLEFADARRFRERYANTIVVGRGEDCALRLLDSTQTETGIQARVMWRGSEYALKAPIFGEHHIGNMCVVFATACTLGVAPEDAILALGSVTQISHRLEVKQGPAGSKMIDDAYNSNPVGFAAALQLLNTLRRDGGRRVLVTPGMVEMGPAHDEQHKKIGELAASTVDVLLPVLPQRIQSLTQAYSSGNPEGKVIPCPTFSNAQAWMNANLTPTDVVLLENDLPDLYEARLRL